jgi:hypothetical protein
MSAGLPITNAIRLEQISGPTAIQILVPQEDFLKKYPMAPMFILFGDAHYSDKNLCQDVDPKYQLHKPEFLNLLCDLLIKKDSMQEKIDFYMEGGDIFSMHIHIPDTNVPMLLINNLFLACQNDTTGQFKSIENIQWQSGDSRFWSAYPLKMMQKIAEKKSQTEPLKYYSLNIFLIKLRSEKPGIKSDEAVFVNNLKSIAYGIRSNGLYLNAAKLAVSPLELYNEYILKDTSLLYYEISKIPPEDAIHLQKMYKQYIFEMMNEFYYKNNAHDEKEQLKLCEKIVAIHQLLMNYSTDDSIFYTAVPDQRGAYLFSNQKDLDLLHDFVVHSEGFMADLYTLARSFSRMVKESTNHSIINICYFGHAHTEHMGHFLSNILGAQNYKHTLNIAPLYIPELNDYNRCIYFKNMSSISSMPSLHQQLNKMRRFRYSPPSGNSSCVIS